jgi:hypothetical protein
VVLGAGAAGAAGNPLQPPSTCTGTLASPGVLAGAFGGNVTVKGVCFVNGGATVIGGDLILAPGSALNATFALNDVRGKGTSSLFVQGNVKVGSGAVLFMGCEPHFSPCSDDPTLTGQNTVVGGVTAVGALAVIIHASTIGGNLGLTNGGGGVTCVPPAGILAAIGLPAFSDAEDNSIGGNLIFSGLGTCWLGALRNFVGHNITDSGNTMADPDANEILANFVQGSIGCFSNSPAVQYGDSASFPNRVHGPAFGECAFNVRQPNPSPDGPLEPISIRA